MLNRQKTLLYLLQQASRPVSKLELTKWAFVLRQEMPTKGGNAFYDFLPYRYGPFSFCLYREMDALIREGYVQGESTWSVTSLANNVADSLSNAVKLDGRGVIDRLGKKKIEGLVDYVYQRHPRFTVNSERLRLADRIYAKPAVYTAGYERLSVDAFLDRLIGSGVERIIDVRNNPIARRFGFHKSTLSKLAGRVQIDYVHLPELGIASSLRRDLTAVSDYKELFDSYERDTLARNSKSIDRVSTLMKEKASVLVCMEADPKLCHRSRLANAVSSKTSLQIHDLGNCCT